MDTPLQAACSCGPAWYDRVLRLWFAAAFCWVCVMEAGARFRDPRSRTIRACADAAERRYGDEAIGLLAEALWTAHDENNPIRCRILAAVIRELQRRR